MSKYLVGSHLLKLDNCRDEDWVDLSGDDYKIRNKIITNFCVGKNTPGDAFKGRILYQLSNGFYIENADYPFKNFNIFDYKEIWINCIKTCFNNYDVDKVISQEILPKHFYHFLYQYYMIKENTHYISDGAKTEVQKIHDLKESSSYFHKLRELINGL